MDIVVLNDYICSLCMTYLKFSIVENSSSTRIKNNIGRVDILVKMFYLICIEFDTVFPLLLNGLALSWKVIFGTKPLSPST